MELITAFPRFRAMYETLCRMCSNVERVMEMFSKELQQTDRNTAVYMIEEQQKMIEQKTAELQEKEARLEAMDAQMEAKDAEIARLREELQKQARQGTGQSGEA